ncbi:MAG: hypothetical protein DWG75_02020, partial [Chloroflexi bacterium]|nr:hypothetical protein [Chloroflexota bacterium]MQC83019.1 hypothetical protein [Chloroflexota bacterium]
MPRLHVEPLDPAVPGRSRYVKVAVNSGRPTYLTFSYAVPADREIAPGEVVHAPFGRQTLQGIVVDGPIDTPGYNPSEVRPLEPPLEGAPRVTPARMELARWLQEYYLSPPWEAHSVFLPPGAGERPERLVARGAEVGEEEPDALSDRQRVLFDALGDEPEEQEALKKRLAPELPVRGFDAALRVLIRRGLADRRYRLARPRGRARLVDTVRLHAQPA